MHFNLYDLKIAAHKFLTVMAKNLELLFGRWSSDVFMKISYRINFLTDILDHRSCRSPACEGSAHHYASA